MAVVSRGIARCLASRGLAVRLIPLSVQSRDHLATITYIYVPSFSSLGSRGFCPVFFPVHFSRIFARAFLGSYAGYYPAFISSVPRYIMPAFRRMGRPADTLFYNSHTHAWVCIVLGKGCPPVRLVHPKKRREQQPVIHTLTATSSTMSNQGISPTGTNEAFGSSSSSKSRPLRTCFGL